MPRWPRPERVVIGAVLLGLLLRGYLYLREPALWHDEAALVLNVISKSYGELLGPLYCSEAAPPLFLWAERAVVQTFGDGLQVLRLLPFLASCLALVLVAWSALKLLPAAAVPWAVLLFAFSDNLLWHTTEAKPYTIDILCAAGLIAIYAGTQLWPLRRQLLLYTLLAPVVIFLSYPGCFLCGGLLVALLPRVWREKRGLVGYAVLTLVIFASFAALALGPARAQRCELMDRCWLRQFPDYTHPWMVPVWVLSSTTEVLRYCLPPIGQMLVGVCIVGWVTLWRHGRRDLVALLALPLGLALVASFLHAYPYGAVRVVVFALPGLVLLIAAGAPLILSWLWSWTRPGALALVAILLTPVGFTAYRTILPRERADTAGAAAFVLRERQADDLVTANHWEYEYYFRQLDDLYQPLADLAIVPAERYWLVLTADHPAERYDFLRRLAGDVWRPVAHREFARTSVFLLEKNEPVRKKPGPASGQ